MKKVATSTVRNQTLDLLRGYFLLVIILNHLHFYPSGLEWITGSSYLYVSAAEGFFLISGIVLGMVRGAKLANKAFKHAAGLLWKRAFQLYITSIILVLLFTLVGWIFMANPGLKFGIFQPVGDILGLFGQTITLQYTYGWADYLRLYAIFIFAAPLAIWLLRRGWWYIVLLISFGVWMLYPIVPIPNGGPSQPFSWQLIFFAGLTVGFHWNYIKARWRKHSKLLQQIIIGTIVSLAALTLILNALVVFGDDLPYIGHIFNQWDDVYSQYFDKDRLPMLRLVLFGIWFVALYWLFQRFEATIKRFAGWLLIPFGTNSLYVYTIQALVVFSVHLIFIGPSHWWPVNLIISIGTVAVVHLALRSRFLMRIIPR